MIRESSRRAKIETLKGLLNGSKTVKDLRQEAGEVMILEYADCDEEPEVFIDRQGNRYSESEMKAREEQLKRDGYLVWTETRTYNSKCELYGFIQEQKG